MKSAELTGDWERKLRLIEKGEYEPEVFKQELYKMVRELTDDVIFNTPTNVRFFEQPEKAAPKKRVKQVIDFNEINCPKCKSVKLIKGKTATGCSNFKVCGFKVPFELMGKKLTDKQLHDLLTKNKTGVIKGITEPGSGEKISGKYILDASFNIQFEKQ